MQNDEIVAEEFLEDSVKNYKIFIDSCALFSEQAELFWQHIVPILSRENKAVFVPYSVYTEVKKYSDSERCKAEGKSTEFNEQAKQALRTIAILQNSGQIKIHTSAEEAAEKKRGAEVLFADSFILNTLSLESRYNDVMLITHDRKLARDVIQTGERESVKTDHKISVQEIDQYGYLCRSAGDERNIFCRLCGKRVNESWTEEGICKACLNDGDTYYCCNCGKPIKYTNRRKYIQKAERLPMCKDCYAQYQQYQQQTYTTRYCVVCNRMFNITNRDRDYYAKNGFQLPTRCPECRNNGYYANSAPQYQYDQPFYYDQPVPPQYVKKRPWWLWAILITLLSIKFIYVCIAISLR